MKALAPLIRELKLALYQWARRDMQRKGGMHPDLPHVVRRIHELTAERPRIEPPRRSRCADLPGMCAGDPACPDRHCPGRLYGLHHTDGGHEFRGGVAWPIEHKRARLSTFS